MAATMDALRRVVRHVGQLLLLRADLAAEELALARSQWIRWLVAALTAVALLAMALAAAGAWLTLILWDRFGAATLAVLALALVVAGALVLHFLLRTARNAEPALAHTRSALHDDYDALLSPAAGTEPEHRQ